MAPLGIVLAGAFLLAALYCGTDPLGHSSMADYPGFEAYPVELPPWSELPTARDPEDRLQRAEIRFVGQIQGPESVAFDPLGRGPYTGVADGRVLFWNGHSWSDFAYTSPIRSELCDPKPSPLSYLKNEHICGRPLGLRFDKKTGDLYIADAYFGLLKVGPEGGLATPLTTEAEGVQLNFTNDLDIDEEGNIYFTDSSTNYQRRNFMQLVFSGEPSGRLLKYNPVTNETTVLLRNLQFPNGVSLSKDGSFFVFCEGSRGRLSRYWLKGEKAGTSDIFAILPGFPDNVRTNEKGEFWVAIHCRRTVYAHLMGRYTRLRKFLLKLPIPAKYQYLMQIGGRLHALIIKYSPDGKLLEILEDRKGKVVRAVSEVEEKDGKLWIGSVLMPFIAVY
ncbi:protein STRICTOSIDINE SYNTHASE-LIKE 3-like [Phoenix dactylifera]|uniref:Protein STRICTOSIDINE SYNTHASE-LIKE 3-like n=1 Tax=Phoenix dactylifera TaxID=42345 RepID=A0A8B8J0E2_PHODC|nr:protein STRICTOSIDINE SYNTHASE-LIKE 3-like [Phoenix dactylifera]